MPASTSPPQQQQLQPSDLLHYLPAYRVLICKECRYAIQPAAISRHLKELHHIYRSDRKMFMDYTLKLDLAEPDEVKLPHPHDPPVPFLPTERGVACEAPGCDHLCVTVKRMKNHWATVHRDVTPNTGHWRYVDLQTFFRGNQLRYFAVMPLPDPSLSPPLSDREQGGLRPSTTVDEVALMKEYTAKSSREDLDLLYHFKVSTSQTFVESDETRHVWGTILPQFALQYPFLMHGIQACAAMHLAYLNPSEHHKYHVLATHHMGLALPLFRNALSNPNAANCHALLAFSHVLILQTFAWQQADYDLDLLLIHENTGELPDWLRIVRNSCNLFKTVWHQIQIGPMKPMIMECLTITPVPEPSKAVRRLEMLATFPFNHHGLPEEIRKEKAYHGARLELCDAFSKAHAMKFTYNLRTIIFIWPVQVTDNYLDLLKERHPAALVLLAHYCILLKPLEYHWYMANFTRRLLTSIYNQLSEEYRSWIQWPIEEIQIQV